MIKIIYCEIMGHLIGYQDEEQYSDLAAVVEQLKAPRTWTVNN